MNRNNIARVVLSVPLALALSTPALIQPATAYANTTQVTIRAVETEDGKQEGGTYDKTGGIGLVPVISVLGASSAGCLALAHRLGRDDADGDAQK